MAAEDVLRNEIRSALTVAAVNTPDAGLQSRELVVERISVAFENYMKTNLSLLVAALKTPGAFQGVGTGTVVISPAGFNAFRL